MKSTHLNIFLILITILYSINANADAFVWKWVACDDGTGEAKSVSDPFNWEAPTRFNPKDPIIFDIPGPASNIILDGGCFWGNTAPMLFDMPLEVDTLSADHGFDVKMVFTSAGSLTIQDGETTLGNVTATLLSGLFSPPSSYKIIIEQGGNFKLSDSNLKVGLKVESIGSITLENSTVNNIHLTLDELFCCPTLSGEILSIKHVDVTGNAIIEDVIDSITLLARRTLIHDATFKDNLNLNVHNFHISKSNLKNVFSSFDYSNHQGPTAAENNGKGSMRDVTIDGDLRLNESLINLKGVFEFEDITVKGNSIINSKEIEINDADIFKETHFLSFKNINLTDVTLYGVSELTAKKMEITQTEFKDNLTLWCDSNDISGNSSFTDVNFEGTTTMVLKGGNEFNFNIASNI